MFYRACTTVCFTALWIINMTDGSLKYTWPLYSENPLLEVHADVAEGNYGCFLQSHTLTLGYTGIIVTGSSSSFVDVNVGDSTNFYDFSFTIYAKVENAGGAGTIFHYKQDDAAVNSNVRKIKDVILWNNQTHLVAELFGPNDEVYGSATAEIDVANFVQHWVGFGVSLFHGEEIKVYTNTGITSASVPVNGAPIGKPGTLRIGTSFDILRPSFHGNVICSGMYDSKDGSLLNARDKCRFEWDNNTATTPLKVCDHFKGYFEVKQRNAKIDGAVTALDYIATMSRVKCADLCLRQELCWTYTLDKVAGSCKIYDADYSSSILHSDGCNYYMRRDKCC